MCPVCNRELDQYDSCGGSYYGGDHYYRASTMGQWFGYTVGGENYFIRLTGKTIQIGRIKAGWNAQPKIPISDIDFDPKHPQPTIDRIRLLETFS